MQYKVNSFFTSSYHKYIRLYFIVLCSFVTGYHLEAQNRSWEIDSTQVVDGSTLPFLHVKPGDTLFLQPGVRDHLLIRNFKGSPGKPIIFMNKGGITEINTEEYYGISINNCRYFRLSGQGEKHIFYGIRISRVQSGTGIGIGSMSSDFEIDHVSVENCPIAGIYAKTDPDCTFGSTREKFTQYNTNLHDNYISNVGNEGLYIGSSKYSGQTVSCNGKDTLLMPSLLKGVRIYNNIVSNTGWDGIQVSSASEDCRIYNNRIINDSQAEVPNQMSGILIGGGTQCDCYNNLISNGKGSGIEVHGLGGSRIFNNIIVNPGLDYLPADRTKMKHGIFVSDVSAKIDSSFYLLFNDIINPKSDGIRFQSVKSRNNLIASNLVVNPGNYMYYEMGNTSFKGKDAYIMIPGPATDVAIKNNFLTRDFLQAKISNEDYSVQIGSPLIDGACSNHAGIDFDFNGKPRPAGINSEIGAVEFDPETLTLNETEKINYAMAEVYPNPVRKLLRVRCNFLTSAPVVLYIYDSRGVLMLLQNHESSEIMANEITINVDRLAQGIYIYKIQAGKEKVSGKFIKVN